MNSPRSYSSDETYGDRQYHLPDYAVEELENYCKGGFHPVNLGDKLGERYMILRKLGYGGYSTVWLAKDELSNKFVAIKILLADTSKSEHPSETAVLEKLAKGFPEHIGHKYILQITDSFSHTGPNGTHDCLVFDVMNGEVGTRVKFSKKSIKTMCYHVLSGLALLHKIGFVNCDFHYNNLLFKRGDIHACSETEVLEHIYPPEEGIKVERVDGQPVDLHAPKYVYTAPCRHLSNWDFSGDDVKDLVFKIGDFGVAIPEGTTPAFTPTPVHLRAPEQLFDLAADSKVDIWTFGCTLFQMITSEYFAEMLLEDPDSGESNSYHIQQLIDRLGPIPADLRATWATADDFVNESGSEVLKSNAEVQISRLALPGGIFGIRTGLGEDDITPKKKVDIHIHEHERPVFQDFLLRMLRWEPSARATAEELLDHPWLAEVKDS